MTDQTPQAQEIHKPFSDDGVLYCGWATGDRVVDGCGELFPCSALRTTPNALALAPTQLGCGNCDGIPGNSRCPACKGAGRMPRPAPEPTFTASEVKELTKTAADLGYALGRKETAEEIAAVMEALDGPMTGENTTSDYLVLAARLAREIGAR